MQLHCTITQQPTPAASSSPGVPRTQSLASAEGQNPLPGPHHSSACSACQVDCISRTVSSLRRIYLGFCFCFVLFFHARGLWPEIKLAKLSLSKYLYIYFCSLWRKLCHNKFHSFFILIFAGDSSWMLPLGTVLLLPRLLSTLACPADAATAWNTCTSGLWQKKK